MVKQARSLSRRGGKISSLIRNHEFECENFVGGVGDVWVGIG